MSAETWCIWSVAVSSVPGLECLKPHEALSKCFLNEQVARSQPVLVDRSLGVSESNSHGKNSTCLSAITGDVLWLENCGSS